MLECRMRIYPRFNMCFYRYLQFPDLNANKQTNNLKLIPLHAFKIEVFGVEKLF